jgi:hypothetical protein
MFDPKLDSRNPTDSPLQEAGLIFQNISSVGHFLTKIMASSLRIKMWILLKLQQSWYITLPLLVLLLDFQVSFFVLEVYIK